MKHIEDLNFRHFHTSMHGPSRSRTESCFRLWENVWREQLENPKYSPLAGSSSDFLHKELGGLFCEDQPVGFMLYQFCDLAKPAHQNLSYFMNYPKELYNEMIEAGERVMIVSQLTVDFHWRKAQTDLPLSEVLMGFAILRFLQSDARFLIASFRDSSHAQKIFHRHGGQKLPRSIAADHVEMQFSQISRESARLSSLQFCSEATMKLWNQFMKRNKEAQTRVQVIDFN